MKKHVLNIGDVKTDTLPSVFTCFGLGSCIGLFIQDRAAGVAGGAHILLPANEQANHDDGLCYNVADAFEQLFDEFRQAGSNMENLRAKVVGGANIISGNGNVGKRNIQSVVDYLIANRVFIAARDVGGTTSRTAHFNSLTSELRVRKSSDHQYKVY